MNSTSQAIDLNRLRVFPLIRRCSLTRAQDILIAPETQPKALPEYLLASVAECASAVRAARARGRSVILIYGAHLLRNGAAPLLDRLMGQGWVTHLATNGAATIHDWEYSWLGASTESVEKNVATGTFGSWDETATYIHVALMAGALDGLGYGGALGRFICEDGAMIPAVSGLEESIRAYPDHPLTGARSDLLRTLRQGRVGPGHLQIVHRWKQASILASAWKHQVTMTVHPGIGYDIISNHPIFNGAVIGRAAETDFKLFAGSVANLDQGVVISIGSAIMGPQVFEKSLSCVNNVRLQDGLHPISGHSIYVVDLQDGGGWDWAQGEPPKTHPAYYLRFCKSFSRMGAPMRYMQCDNVTFVHHLQRLLDRV